MQEQWVRIVEGLGNKLLVKTVMREICWESRAYSPRSVEFCRHIPGGECWQCRWGCHPHCCPVRPQSAYPDFRWGPENNQCFRKHINYLPWNTYTTRRFVKFNKKRLVCSQESLKHSIINKINLTNFIEARPSYMSNKVQRGFNNSNITNIQH